MKYLFATLFILSGTGGLFTGSIIAGMLLIILGILLMPIISEELSQKIKLWKYRVARYGIYFILLLFIGGTIKKQPKIITANSNKNSLEEGNNISDTPKINIVKPQQDEIQMDNSDFWNDFDPIVKKRIYIMIKEKNCGDLQEEFNITADNMDRLQASGKSGARNLQLMNFLEEKMKDLNCHN